MTTVEDPNSPYDQPVISDDFLLGDVAAGLERMRLRLLDLTARNRLLNFKHTKKSSLRVVDELPDQLFTRLSDGKELYFKPVPMPRGFARPTRDPETQLLLSALDEQSGRSASRPQYPSAKDYATTLGLATDFELPTAEATGQSSPGKHADNKIQCLHYPDELESILRSISSASRLAIEETGTNMLYLVFGFFDWYEGQESDQVRSAPVILLPATLRREDADEETRTYRYAVRYSGEDILANICLQEKLRRDFKLELPALEDFETPDSYFEKLKPLLKKDERWCVRRQVTLTLLSFGKLLMYRDLDSRTWPSANGPADHVRVREFFHGIQRERATFAADYRLDESPIREKLPAVVDEADSSQHSALVDAIDGKNLVIEGPPGTGKSQTITNLIAAAITLGKSVLFVSEKLAALEVVRHRLDRAGLGSFCLELHSHKSQKRQLLDDIDARIKLSQQLQPPRSGDQRFRLLEEDRQRLTAYAELVNKPFGSLDRSLHDVMWHARRRRRALRFEAALVEDLRVANAEQIDESDLENRRQRLAQFGVHLRLNLENYDTLTDHPWYGFENGELSFLDHAEVATRLNALREGTGQLAERVVELNRQVGGEWLAGNLNAVERVRIEIDALPREANVIPNLVPHLRDPRLRQHLREFRAWVLKYRELARAVEAKIGRVPALATHDIAAVAQTIESGRNLSPRARLIGDFAKAAQAYSHAATMISRSQSPFDHAKRWLSSDFRFTSVGCYRVRLAFDRVHAAPLPHIGYRHPGLQGDDAEPALEAAGPEASELNSQRSHLSERFALNLAPALSVLRQHVSTMANAGWWSFLDGEFRSAGRAYRAMAVQGTKLDRSTMAAGYRELLEYAERKDRFDQNQRFQSVAGQYFDSIDTPFSALRNVYNWWRDTRRAFVFAGDDGVAMCSMLWNAPREQLVAIREADGDARKITRPISDAIDAVSATASWRGSEADPTANDEEFAALRPQLENWSSQLSTNAAKLAGYGFPEETQLDDIPDLLRLLTELDSLRQLVTSAKEVAAALGTHFNGTGTDLDAIARSEEFFSRVSESQIPAALKQWILTEEAPERLREAHAAAAELGTRLGECRAAWNEFSSLGRASPAKWFGNTSEFVEQPLGQVAERCQRALSGQHQFAAWLDYLRARQQVAADGVERVIALAEQRRIETSDLADAFGFVFANSLVNAAFGRHRELAQFSGLSHEAIRKRFAQLDRESIELQRRQAAWTISRRLAPIGMGTGPVGTWTELSLLENEISKQRRHIPLRQLMRRAGRALQALKPCFMMGPLSVAQYLVPGAMKFDLVVMDEASQLRPEDALGAIARASQVVIVGDRMQLPPTSFFDRVGEDEEDADEAETRKQSARPKAFWTWRPLCISQCVSSAGITALGMEA